MGNEGGPDIKTPVPGFYSPAIATSQRWHGPPSAVGWCLCRPIARERNGVSDRPDDRPPFEGAVAPGCEVRIPNRSGTRRHVDPVTSRFDCGTAPPPWE